MSKSWQTRCNTMKKRAVIMAQIVIEMIWWRWRQRQRPKHQFFESNFGRLFIHQPCQNLAHISVLNWRMLLKKVQHLVTADERAHIENNKKSRAVEHTHKHVTIFILLVDGFSSFFARFKVSSTVAFTLFQMIILGIRYSHEKQAQQCSYANLP